MIYYINDRESKKFKCVYLVVANIFANFVINPLSWLLVREASLFLTDEFPI